MTDAHRRAHYRRFFETDPPPGDDLLIVLGNCQAESVRLLLDPDDRRSVRVPPVFELDAEDVVLLDALLARATAVAAQPVRDDYRGLALGTSQLAGRLRGAGRMITFPIVRYAGLHPFHVVVHSSRTDLDPPRPLPQPPVVPYHDLRVVAAAVGQPSRRADLDADGVREIARGSLDELRRREQLTDVTVSGSLARPGAEHMRTVNHPGNPVLLALATGVAEQLDLRPPRDPGRPLLNSVRAPIEPVVAATWGLPPRSIQPSWTLDDRPVPAESISELHAAWYAEHPDVARAVWTRHRETAEVLGLV